MRALSIRQPWLYAILHLGKRVENRSWASSYVGPVLLHAGKAYCKGDEEDISLVEAEQQAMREAPRGVIAGVATIIGCVTPDKVPRSQREWACGPWCFVLRDVRAFATPISYRGALGFFDVPDHVVAEAMAA
jgi:hypothetical protein